MNFIYQFVVVKIVLICDVLILNFLKLLFNLQFDTFRV